MNITNYASGLIVSVAVLAVGFSLYQQEERHFAESQRWLDVCKKQLKETLRIEAERIRDDTSLPKEVRENAQRGIDGWDQDYVYSHCYKEWHAGN
jgi:hypothetical protein